MPEYFLLDDIAEYCAVNQKGDCGVQALLFITLCRIVGIPARWQSGLSVNTVPSARTTGRSFSSLPMAGCTRIRPLAAAPTARVKRNGTPSTSAIWIRSGWLRTRIFRRLFSRPDPDSAPILTTTRWANVKLAKGLLTGQFEYFHDIIDVHSIRRG